MTSSFTLRLHGPRMYVDLEIILMMSRSNSRVVLLIPLDLEEMTVDDKIDANDLVYISLKKFIMLRH